MMKFDDKTMSNHFTKIVIFLCLLVNFSFVSSYQELDRIVHWELTDWDYDGETYVKELVIEELRDEINRRK